ncbi:MAG TPA: EscU/YscU/HrcU family type III secretion system export apparatus switch protein [bacterium]
MVTHDSSATPKAAALRYRHGADTAPQMIARGSGDIARQIVEIARECGVPIEEDGDLLHLLEQLDLGEEIPTELYTMVAEVLAFAYVVNGKYLDLQLRERGPATAAPGADPVKRGSFREG